MKRIPDNLDRHFSWKKWMSSDHLKNPIMQDTRPHDIGEPKKCSEFKPPLPDIKCHTDLISTDRYLLYYTRPDLKFVEFCITEMPQTILVIWDQKNMHLTLDYSYSLDSGHTWSRYYEQNYIESFLQLLRDEYAKGFEVTVKIRLEAFLDKEGDFYDSIHDEDFFIGIDKILLNYKDVKIKSIYIQNSADFDLPQRSQLFDPYANMEAALHIQERASLAINHMFGHWAYYFKTDPDTTTRDLTLKTYRLYNVVDMKKIKISVPGNKFPTSRNIYSEWGIALPDEFNIHIMHDTFWTAFGNDTFPHTNDYVYFPITGKLYNVNAYYDNANFMYKSLWWECTLVKYEDSANVIKTTEDSDFSDETEEFMNLDDNVDFLDNLEKEVETADPKYLNTKLFEAFRHAIHKDVDIVNYELFSSRLKLFDNMYHFTNVSSKELAVYFDLKHCEANNISIYGWFVFEKLSPARDIWNVQDTSGKNVLQLQLSKQKLLLTYNCNKDFANVNILKSTYELQPDKHYAIVGNFSIMYRTMSLCIVDYDYKLQKANKVIEFITGDINVPEIYLLNRLIFMGGNQLVSSIGLDKMCYDKDNVMKLVTRVTPDMDVNVFFDKADLPISENQNNGY